MEKHIRGLRVRPCVLFKLLCFLIDRGHETFRDKGSPQELKERVRQTVEKEYPETQGHLPEEQREGEVPSSLLQYLREAEETRRKEEASGQKWDKRLKLFRTKNATPGDGARSVDSCLDDIRPNILAMGSSASALTDPHTAKVTALEQYGIDNAQGCGSNSQTPEADAPEAEPIDGTGALHVQSDTKMVNQWDSSYPSRILPFVIPKNVSGDPVLILRHLVHALSS